MTSLAILLIALTLLHFCPAGVSDEVFYILAAFFLALIWTPYWLGPLVPVRPEDRDLVPTRLYRHWLRFRYGKGTPDKPGPDYFL